ncbi:hypothetical protein EDS67_00680 [candidate division KSB1 bacterium]|nr:MAG: hypothetical protein EDS67_00680 [candidate division KSB1 bacterium]MCE7940113.1 hypothetical protein [Chlorobi bacterium CHB1]MDL1873589.1 hypothetical protein [Cytophagia bacterium CHB2]
MCYFLEIGFPKDPNVVRFVRRSLRMLAVIKCTSTQLAGKLPANYAAYLIGIPEGCSCCLAGHYFEQDDDQEQESARKAAKLEMHVLEKYRRKGWPDEKIKRALTDKRKAENRQSVEELFPEDIEDRVAQVLQETIRTSGLPIYLCIYELAGSASTKALARPVLTKKSAHLQIHPDYLPKGEIVKAIP